ncbi:MAG: hypothetical protein Q8T03_13700 [Bacteroidota bacterium]|nr:hypothetical protein [Bacteroidota bacterium]
MIFELQYADTEEFTFFDKPKLTTDKYDVMLKEHFESYTVYKDVNSMNGYSYDIFRLQYDFNILALDKTFPVFNFVYKQMFRLDFTKHNQDSIKDINLFTDTLFHNFEVVLKSNLHNTYLKNAPINSSLKTKLLKANIEKYQSTNN